jgi:hypothetical protein
MHKLTKVGLSALCGSLAAVSSANAGEMTVTGGVDMSYVSYGGANTGNPIGMGSNLTFKGAGELDNGWTFSVTTAMLNADAYSTTVVNLDMGSLGSLNINQGDSTNGIDAVDDKMPTAWEESWGAGLGTGVQLVRGIGTANNIQYKSPTAMGITITGAVAFDVGSADVNDKGVSGTSGDDTGRGYDLLVNINPSFGTEILSGLNIFAGAHNTERFNSNSATVVNDRYEGVAGATFDIGPIALGYQTSGISTGTQTNGAGSDWYKNSAFGVAFNVNDDLSISYGERYSQNGDHNPNDAESVHMEITSLQAAYTMGGASVRVADVEVDNASYQLGTTDYDKEATIISVSLAF